MKFLSSFRRNLQILVIFSVLIFAVGSSISNAQEVATPEDIERAKAHYARAKSLIIAALAEFDKASSIASPELILSSKEWKRTLRERAQELNHIIAPQARISEKGVRLIGDRRLLAK